MKKLSSMSLVMLLVVASDAEVRAPGRASAGSQAPARRVPGRDPKKLQVLILTGYNMHDWRPSPRPSARRWRRRGGSRSGSTRSPSAATSGRSTATTRSS